MRKTIFLSGSSGFIGRNIIEQLSGKYKIFAPSHKELDLLDQASVEEYFKKNKFEVVIHCSNVGGTRDTVKLTNVASSNLRMFFNIIRLNKLYKRMIFLGSGAEYDKRNPLIKVKESDFDKNIPIDEYGFSKYVCSKYIQEADNIVNLRLFGVYGKYEDISLRFISYSICQNILGLPIKMNQNVVFDYLYINDLVRIIDLFIQKFPKKKFLNVGRGISIDLLTIAKLVNKISEKKSKIIIKKRDLNNEYTCENSLLLTQLPRDFQFTDFKISLKELFNYYRAIKS